MRVYSVKYNISFAFTVFDLVQICLICSICFRFAFTVPTDCIFRNTSPVSICLEHKTHAERKRELYSCSCTNFSLLLLQSLGMSADFPRELFKISSFLDAQGDIHK